MTLHNETENLLRARKVHFTKLADAGFDWLVWTPTPQFWKIAERGELNDHERQTMAECRDGFVPYHVITRVEDARTLIENADCEKRLRRILTGGQLAMIYAGLMEAQERARTRKVPQEVTMRFNQNGTPRPLRVTDDRDMPP